MIKKYQNHTVQTNQRPCVEEQHNNHKTPGRQNSKATNSLIHIKMIAKLEKTQRNA